MNIVDIINKKRESKVLTKEEINYVVDSYMKEEVKDYQVSSLLMAICLNGMNEEEVSNLTAAMLYSGESIDLSTVDGAKVDKHSTGGVGDKTTLVIAPLVASCGLIVSKMSGRGLGHTGGTIDKLESIKNFDVNLSNEKFLEQLKSIGVAITTSSLNITPADKKLYALRDVTGTVSSIPLIASSIMSKKIATNADKIVLDVKVGKGALIKNLDEAVELAETMIQIGKSFSKETIALITNMDYPLGNSIGNGVEVREAIDTLKGNGDKNFKELCLTIASYMVSVGKGIDIESAREEVKTNLEKGLAYEKFVSMVTYQNGILDNIAVSSNTISYNAVRAGYVNSIDALGLGKFAMDMGAGRKTKDDAIDHGVGVVLNCKCGDYVKQGDVLATLYVNKNIDISELDNMFVIEDSQKELEPLIYKIIK